MHTPQIDIIPAHSIDKQKWDNCILNSSSPLLYAHALYLDFMADNWHAVIINNYEAVMPIPWRKKFGFVYCYDVPFIQQLGCFLNSNEDYSSLILKILFSFCGYGNYNFSYHNNNIYNSSAGSNYITDLSAGYEAIRGNYKTDFITNLKKASRQELSYSNDVHDTAIETYKKLYAARMPFVTEKDFDNFNGLCNYLEPQNNVAVRKVTGANNELLSIALLLKDEKRLYNLMNSTTEAGRKTEANHFLFDSIFREFAGTGLIFDFEGSDIPGVKKFYEKCGAVNQPYYRLHFNHLPFPLNLLKR